MAGDGEQAQAHCDEATELVDELSDEEAARRLNTLAHLTAADVWLDRYAAATRHARRALEICRRTGQGEQFPLIVQMLGVSLWVQGKPLEAEELFDGAVEAARLSDNVQNLLWNLFNRSLAALAAGDLDVALATAEESFELAANLEPGIFSVATAATYASALLEAGQADQGVDLLPAGGEELRVIGGGWRARFLEMLTRALLATGRRADAAGAAAATQACADAVALPTAAGMASLAAAEVALDAGESTTAVERALAAVAAFEAAEALWDAARARELAGRALAHPAEIQRARARGRSGAEASRAGPDREEHQRPQIAPRDLHRRVERREYLRGADHAARAESQRGDQQRSADLSVPPRPGQRIHEEHQRVG